MLRIVSLSEWITESGLFAETLAEYAIAQHSGGDTRAAVKDLANIMVRGMSYGSPGNAAASRSRLNRFALEQLQQMAKCRYLPLEDVHEDLKIWHLTLLRRPARKKLAMMYGRVQKREGGDFDIDPALLAQMGEDGLGPGGARAGDWDLSGWEGGAGGYGPGGAGYDPNFPNGYDPNYPDGRRPDDGLGPDGKPLRGSGYDEGELDADGNPIGKDGRGGRRSRTGSRGSESGGDDKAGRKRGSKGGSGDGGRDAAAKKKAEEEAAAAARKKAEEEAKAAGKDGLDESADGLGAGDAREQTEEELLLAAGNIFKIKKVAEEVILDEFEKMLLPPPPLPAGDQARPDSQAGARRRHAAGGPAFAFSSGVRSNLADDFRKCIEEAFRLIDFPDEAKKRRQEEAEVAAFLRDDVPDPAMESLLSRSHSQMNLKNDASLLETHLRMRAEKHGRRLQLRTEKAMRATHGNSELWPRRIKGCKQAMGHGAIAALTLHAEMRARESLSTAPGRACALDCADA